MVKKTTGSLKGSYTKYEDNVATAGKFDCSLSYVVKFGAKIKTPDLSEYKLYND